MKKEPYSRIKKRISVCLFLIAFSCSALAQNADINLLKDINLHRNRALDPTFKFITKTATPLSFSAPIITYSVGLIKSDRTLKSKGLYLGATIVGSAFICTALKYAVNRDRPFVTYPIIENETSAFSPSFPSGHTSTAFATATSLSLAFPRWYVIAPTFMWASAVGYSRMDLGVHYPSDVLAGAIIGSGSACLSYILNNKLKGKAAKIPAE